MIVLEMIVGLFYPELLVGAVAGIVVFYTLKGRLRL